MERKVEREWKTRREEGKCLRGCHNDFKKLISKYANDINIFSSSYTLLIELEEWISILNSLKNYKSSMKKTSRPFAKR